MTTDKTFWAAIKAADWAVPDGHTVTDLTPSLVALLASTDPVLRDEIGYECFVAWIERDTHYSHTELHQLIDTLTANLQDGISETGSDSVLKRSFSALVLSIIGHYALTEDFLDTDAINTLLDKALAYLLAEKDLRGYDDALGWVHAVAHTADLLKFLARNPHSTADQHTRILNAIAAKLGAAEGIVYTHDEDERLVWAVFDIMRRDLLTQDDWTAWLKTFTDWLDAHKAATVIHGDAHKPYQNQKAFLRSLMFTVDVIVDEGGHLGAVHTLATALLPAVKNTARQFGKGTIYAG